MKRVLLSFALLACSRSTRPAPQAVEQRVHEIDALGTSPDDWAVLLQIAAGEHPWNQSLDAAGEIATRCRALMRLEGDGAVMPRQFIGSVFQRYSTRLDDPDGARRVLRLLDDPSSCDGTTIAKSTLWFVENIAFPSLRGELAKRHLDRAVARIDQLASWHPSPAAEQIEQAVTLGDVEAFRKTIVALANTHDADRASVSDTGIAAYDWLMRLVLQRPELSCCGALEAAIADGELGEEFVARLAVEPDRDIRRAMWLVLATQPRPRSAARLREIADNETDPDVKFEANDALGLAKVGGQRVHDLENAKHELERDAGP